MILTIEATTAEELKAKVLNLAACYGATSSAELNEAPAIDKEPPAAETPAAETPAEPRKTRSKKAARAAPASSDPQSEPVFPSTNDTPAAESVTIEQVRKGLEQVMKEKGYPQAQAVLARNGCKRLSDLTPAGYGAFLKDCEAAVAGQDMTAAAVG